MLSLLELQNAVLGNAAAFRCRRLQTVARLLVSELSRLGRSLSQVIKIVETLGAERESCGNPWRKCYPNIRATVMKRSLEL